MKWKPIYRYSTPMSITYKKAGFTLAELIVVIAIVAVLSALGFVGYFGYLSSWNDFKRVADMALIQGELSMFRREHAGLYPQAQTGTQIQSGSTIAAFQYQFDSSLAGALGIANVPKDPRTGAFYVYSTRQDKRSYQISASMENSSSVAYVFDTAYAWFSKDPGGYVAYVAGDYVPANKNVLPGLIYAVTPGTTFKAGTPASFDIAVPSNLAKAVLHGQSVNLAYEKSGKMYAGGDASYALADLLSASTVVDAWVGTAFLSCTGVYSPTSVYQAGENEILPYMAGTARNTQIGWQYRTCDGNTGAMGTLKYSCANVSGANFDATCKWVGCQAGYVPVESPSAWAPACRAELLPPMLSYPQNGAFGLPVDGTLAWNPVAGSNGTYVVYMGISTASMTQTYSGPSLSTSYSSLSAWTTYYWKVKTCDAYSTCKESAPWSFTTASVGGSSGTATGGTVGGTAADPCPSGVTCRVDDATVTYVGCSNTVDSSTYGDCQNNSDSFWTSDEAYAWALFWNRKVLSYRVRNNSMGTLKFSVNFGSGSNAVTVKPSTTNPDSAQGFDTDGDGINNLYWTAGNGCSSINGNVYSVAGNSSCFILVYGRGDHSWPDSLETVGYFFVKNEEPSNGTWNFNGNTSKALTGMRYGITLPWCRLWGPWVPNAFNCSLK